MSELNETIRGLLDQLRSADKPGRESKLVGSSGDVAGRVAVGGRRGQAGVHVRHRSIMPRALVEPAGVGSFSP